jgi:hypothetical protein
MIDPRDLEDIRNTLQGLSERRTISRIAKGVPDRDELSKCNTIVERLFRTFEVVRYPCHIVIVFSRKLQLYMLIALRMNSDNTRHQVNILFEQNSVSLYR